jgi:hypothetical protein
LVARAGAERNREPIELDVLLATVQRVLET